MSALEVRLNRRGFLKALIAVPLAALALPRVEWVDAQTVSGINQATYTYWRNQMTGPTEHDFEALRAAMSTVHQQCSR